MSSSTATARNRWAPMHDHHHLIFRSAQGNLNLQRLEPGSLFAGSFLSFEFFLQAVHVSDRRTDQSGIFRPMNKFVD